MLPHAKDAYGIRSSGIPIEGIADGKVFIISRDTLLAELAIQREAERVVEDEAGIQQACTLFPIVGKTQQF